MLFQYLFTESTFSYNTEKCTYLIYFESYPISTFCFAMLLKDQKIPSCVIYQSIYVTIYLKEIRIATLKPEVI